MWAVECKNFGPNPEFFYSSCLTKEQARSLVANLSNSGEWAFCRAWDKDAERAWEEEKKKNGTLV